MDVLFQSAADDLRRPRARRGHDRDGRSTAAQGAAWIKAQGGSILTEAEETCIVYGMPRSVVEAGLSDESVPLDRLAEAIMERI